MLCASTSINMIFTFRLFCRVELCSPQNNISLLNLIPNIKTNLLPSYWSIYSWQSYDYNGELTCFRIKQTTNIACDFIGCYFCSKSTWYGINTLEFELLWSSDYLNFTSIFVIRWCQNNIAVYVSDMTHIQKT